MRRALTAAVAILLFVGGITVARRGATAGSPANGGRPAARAEGSAAWSPGSPPTAPPSTAPPAPPPPAEPVALPLAGCPPPPPAPGSEVAEPPWRPDVLVADEDLPEPLAPAAPDAPSSDLRALEGKGMWVWKYRQSEGGDPDAIVARAVATGLRQIWVRVGDSRDGFYAADVLAELVPRAHRAGLSVIGWGFPFLWDPVGDAQWTAEALAWRGPGDVALDGFSPDVEMASEGVELSALRTQVYLGLARRAAAARLLVATVYRPSDEVWGTYPYEAIAPYVDAFAPMVYWGCTEPGGAAAQTLERLGSLRPLHLIGQGYNMAEEGGRTEAPDAAETARFLDVARRGGALGASLWVWQSAAPDQWGALADFRW